MKRWGLQAALDVLNTKDVKCCLFGKIETQIHGIGSILQKDNNCSKSTALAICYSKHTPFFRSFSKLVILSPPVTNPPYTPRI